MRLWCIIRKNQKNGRQAIVQLNSADIDGVMDALREGCKVLDLAMPLVLEKHKAEINDYGHTAFLPDDFIEGVAFERLEIEILLDERAQRRKSSDPRNDFS